MKNPKKAALLTVVFLIVAALLAACVTPTPVPPTATPRWATPLPTDTSVPPTATPTPELPGEGWWWPCLHIVNVIVPDDGRDASGTCVSGEEKNDFLVKNSPEFKPWELESLNLEPGDDTWFEGLFTRDWTGERVYLTRLAPAGELGRGADVWPSPDATN